MFHVLVQRHLNKPIEEVFEALSDHANYESFKGIHESHLIEEGKVEKNGVGALREIVVGSSVLHERIVAFERPIQMDYVIEYSKPLPYQHDFGRITLAEQDDGTLVVWESSGHIAIPILGNLYFDKQISKLGTRAFGSILKSIDM